MFARRPMPVPVTPFVVGLMTFVFLITSSAFPQGKTPKKETPPPGGVQPMCNPCYIVSVTPKGGSVTNPPNTNSNVVYFDVYNSGQFDDSYTFTCTSSGGVSCVSVAPSSATIWGGYDAWVQVTYNVGSTTGTVGLTATGHASDDGWYSVTFPAPPPPAKPGVALRNYNGDNWDRSLCLTSGAGEAAAWQCGDLVVTHALPGYATMGRERSLTLLHNSTLAVPRPTVAVSVSEPGGPPDSVYVELSVGNPGTVRQYATYGGWSGATRQIALVYVDLAVATGVYPFTFRVQNRYGGTTYDSTVSGNLIIVNRQTSEFGTGWALVGVEQLYFNQPVGASNGSILWVGGDGSAKLYAPGGTNTWIAPPGAYRDTLRFDPGTTTYTRTLRHRIQVTFDAQGHHIRTTNRTGQVSQFFWNGGTGRLDSIAVPPAGVAGTVYRLAYDGNGKLDKVTDPAGRVLDATVANGRLATLLDPDQYSTNFAYFGAGRMSARTNRSGFTTTYWYGWGAPMDSVRVPLDTMAAAGQHDTATTRFVWWSEQGIWKGASGNTAVDTALAYAKVFGARNVGDTAEFWVDRWGAPVKVRDPLGNQTLIARGDASYPALVTRSQTPDGRIVGASYNARGNLQTVTDSTFQGVQGNGAMQAVPTSYVYDNVNVPDSPTEVDGPVDTTRAVYDDALGLPLLFTAQGGHKTAFQYIPSGSYTGLVTSVTDSAVAVVDTTLWTKSYNNHLVTQFQYDAWGNDTATISPLGYVTRLVRDAAQRVHSVYDPAGHQTDYYYDAMNRAYWVDVFEPGAQMRAYYFYNKMGTLDSITDPGGARRGWRYDAAGRPSRMIDEVGGTEFRFFNRSGLVDSTLTRNYGMLRYTYDVAGRLTQTIFPANVAQGVSIPGDTIVRTYDAVGRLLTVRNHNGADTLTYNLEGTIRSDHQATATNFTTRSWYDIGGRRVKFFNGTDTVYYHYGTDARLDTLRVVWGSPGVSDAFAFSWDGLGRRDRLVYTAIQDTVIYGYDKDGRFRLLCSKHTGGPEGHDSLDQRVRHTSIYPDGLVRSSETYSLVDNGADCAAGGRLTDHISNAQYDARHELLSQSVLNGNESYSYDWSRNMLGSSTPDQGTWSNYYIIWTYRLAWRENVSGGSNTYTYDGNGNLIKDLANSGYTVKTYYNAINQLVGDSVWNGIQWIGSTTLFKYDGLGRRVLGNGAFGFDGDNVIRNGVSSPWRYVQGPGIDDPLVARYFNGASYIKYYYLTDGQGRMLAFTDSTGLYGGTTALAYSQNGGNQAGGIERAQTFTNSRSEWSQAPKLSFYRNRYYDQQTKRWMQEDPIGPAGGANLYAYAGNNPVTFTDPFGLCDPKKDKKTCELVAQGTVGVTAGTRGGGKVSSVVGVKWQAGITGEVGIRRTVDLNKQKAENEGVGVLKVGASASMTVLGVTIGFRIGFDSEDRDGGAVKTYSKPDDDGTISISGQYPPAGLGISGSYKVNPAGVYLGSQPSIAP